MSTQPTGQPHPWQLNFQEAASPVMENLHDMHSLLLHVITCIAIAVLILLGYILFRFHHRRNPYPADFTHNTMLEIFWTLRRKIKTFSIKLDELLIRNIPI